MQCFLLYITAKRSSISAEYVGLLIGLAETSTGTASDASTTPLVSCSIVPSIEGFAAGLAAAVAVAAAVAEAEPEDLRTDEYRKGLGTRTPACSEDPGKQAAAVVTAAAGIVGVGLEVGLAGIEFVAEVYKALVDSSLPGIWAGGIGLADRNLAALDVAATASAVGAFAVAASGHLPCRCPNSRLRRRW